MILDEQITAEISKILSASMTDTYMRKIIFSYYESPGLKGSSSWQRYKWAELTFAIAELFNDNKEPILPGAIAMELFALAADIFDDIQDQDNHQMPWGKIPVAQAISLANSLLFISYQTLLSVGNLEHLRQLVQIFNQTGLKASAGQYREFGELTKSCSSVDQYIEIISKKSGSFPECACKIGGVLAGAPQKTVDELGELGINIGIIAQISNDLRDILDFHNKSDFINKKQTLPFLYLLDVLEGERAAELEHLITTASSVPKAFTQKEQQRLSLFIHEEGAIHYCLVFQEMFRQQALILLQQIQTSDEQKRKLEMLIDNIVGQRQVI
jgi:competence protein ComQ